MTDMTTTFAGSGASSPKKSRSRRFKIDETHWGYTVRTVAGSARGLIIAQTISVILGAAFMAGAFGMWLLPATGFATETIDLRLFPTIVFAALAVLFIWYGTRGVLSHIQFDTSRGEIREVTRTRGGKLIIIGCYGFDTVSGVHTEPSETTEDCDLVLRYRNGCDALIIASGQDADLTELRERISRDVVVGSNAALSATVSGEA